MYAAQIRRPFRKLSKHIAAHIEKELAGLPVDFHSSYRFVRTGNNLCHAITLSFIAAAIKSIPGVAYIGFDVRLNRGSGVKIQPDVVGFNSDLKPLVLADFESPNSSDARVVPKDFVTYNRWTGTKEKSIDAPPYFIITCLPDAAVDDWEHRYMNKGNLNFEHSAHRKVISANPLRYWSNFWATRLGDEMHSNISFLNIGGRVVSELKFVSAG